MLGVCSLPNGCLPVTRKTKSLFSPSSLEMMLVLRWTNEWTAKFWRQRVCSWSRTARIQLWCQHRSFVQLTVWIELCGNGRTVGPFFFNLHIDGLNRLHMIKKNWYINCSSIFRGKSKEIPDISGRRFDTSISCSVINESLPRLLGLRSAFRNPQTYNSFFIGDT